MRYLSLFMTKIEQEEINFCVYRRYLYLAKSKTDMKQKFDDELIESLTEQARQLLLKKIFQQNRFASRDGLNEYDENFSFFTDRGDLIPVEMREALARLENEKLEQTTNVAETDRDQQDQDSTEDV